MSEEEYIRNRLDMINRNSYYGIMIDTEITKTVRNHIKRLEEMKMKSTSVQKIENVKSISFIIENDPIEEKHKLSIVASTNDDIFEFDFEGPEIIQQCKASGLFTGWEKGQKIKELEYKLKQVEEDKERLTERYKYLKTMNEEYSERIKALQRNYNLKEAANEAQHKFIREYAGKGTEIEFNYAIDDVNEVSYVVVEKEYLEDLKNFNTKCCETNSKLREENRRLRSTAKEGDYVCLGSIPYSADDIKKLKEKIKKLKELKTPTIENFEEPSTRSDILDQAKKCVCGQREQDYGSPETNFQLIADLWNQYLFKEPGAKEIFGIGPMDVAMMMALMKIARIRNGGGSGDSFVDLAGYAACGGEIWHSNEETNGDSNQETDTE